MKRSLGDKPVSTIVPTQNFEILVKIKLLAHDDFSRMNGRDRNRSVHIVVVAKFFFALTFFFLPFDPDFGRGAYHDRYILYFYVGKLKSVHFFGGETVFLDEPV